MVKAVSFNRAMCPYSQGDVALLPDVVADKLVDGGDASRHALPRAPHGADALHVVAAEQPRDTYRTKVAKR
ncbi:MAG: hypothetical protein ABS57_19750 [Mesorhizobium sp. SCN 65-12]|nr:MAG: hypothetical protein ABS57_19750 [Mesorhizobium sp. SCN 65-12]